MKLGKQEIDELECPAGRRDRLVFDEDMPGFGIRVTSDGSKVFLFQYAAAGKTRRLRLGVYGDITPAQARKLAQKARGRVADGGDPVGERKEARAATKAAAAAEALILKSLIEDWAAVGLKDRSAAHRTEAERALTAGFPTFLLRPVHQLMPADAQRAIDAIGKSRPMMARRTRDYGRAMFNWAIKRQKVTVNPFASVAIETREVSRDRVLTDGELADAWHAAGTLGHPFGPYIRLLILTLQRRGEVAGMGWAEVASDLSTWTIPAERSKNGKAHIVHLVPAAQEILRKIKRPKGVKLVFTTTGTTPISAFSRARERLAVAIADVRAEANAAAKAPPKKTEITWHLHDFRRTGVTKLAELGIPPHVADRLLNHVQGTIKGVAAVYQRHEFLTERRSAIVTWAEFVLDNAASTREGTRAAKPKKAALAKRRALPES